MSTNQIFTGNWSQSGANASGNMAVSTTQIRRHISHEYRKALKKGEKPNLVLLNANQLSKIRATQQDKLNTIEGMEVEGSTAVMKNNFILVRRGEEENHGKRS